MQISSPKRWMTHRTFVQLTLGDTFYGAVGLPTLFLSYNYILSVQQEHVHAWPNSPHLRDIRLLVNKLVTCISY